MKELKTSEFKKEIADFKGLAVVDFWAAWCGPCHMLSPVIIEVAKEFEKDVNIKFFKVNVDLEGDLAITYMVQSIPTVKFFKDGKVVDEFVGVVGKEKIKSIIEKYK